MPEFIQKAIDYAKEHLALTAVLLAVATVLIVVIIVLIVKSSKNAKKRKAAALEAEAKKAEEERLAKEQAEAETKAKAEAEAKAKAEEEAAAAAAKKAEEERLAQEKAEAERLAAEQAKAEAEAKAKAEKEAAEKAKEQAAKEAKTVKTEPAKKKAPASTAKKAEAKPAAAKAKKAPAKTEAVKEAPAPVAHDDEDDELGSRYTGKWVICRVIVAEGDGKEKAEADESYFFELRASNGEKLLSSEEYTTYNGVLNGIKTHKENILRNNFKITLSKKGDYIFKLLSGKNMLLCMGENYKTRARCERAIESTKRFAQTAVIDENVQDQVIKLPVEDDSELPAVSESSNGKWIISSNESTDGEQVFYFELFANNGEKLLSSEEYTTYIGAVNGIGTHKANIEKGNFRISLTKKGDYIYKLLSGNGQLLCLGEHYKTKRLCMNAVESVKRFALNSPVLTETEIAHEHI